MAEWPNASVMIAWIIIIVIPEEDRPMIPESSIEMVVVPGGCVDRGRPTIEMAPTDVSLMHPALVAPSSTMSKRWRYGCDRGHGKS
jgi:hypothetical protein